MNVAVSLRLEMRISSLIGETIENCKFSNLCVDNLKTGFVAQKIPDPEIKFALPKTSLVSSNVENVTILVWRNPH
jgi:hypothetical protein